MARKIAVKIVSVSKPSSAVRFITVFVKMCFSKMDVLSAKKQKSISVLRRVVCSSLPELGECCLRSVVNFQETENERC
jgi:hypothetical protein